jgi:hypothetical protein
MSNHQIYCKIGKNNSTKTFNLLNEYMQMAAELLKAKMTSGDATWP